MLVSTAEGLSGLGNGSDSRNAAIAEWAEGLSQVHGLEWRRVGRDVLFTFVKQRASENANLLLGECRFPTKADATKGAGFVAHIGIDGSKTCPHRVRKSKSAHSADLGCTRLHKSLNAMLSKKATALTARPSCIVINQAYVFL